MTEGNLGTENKKERILYSSVGEAEAVRGNWDQTLWGHYRSHKGFWCLAYRLGY